MNCNQCEMLSINGVNCHEQGCPNSGKRFEEGEWVRYFQCWDCGCDVQEGEACDCRTLSEDED